MAVRQAIGDSGHTQRLIRTVRGRGYGFVAPVSAWDPAVPVEEQRPPLLATPGHMDSPGSPTVLLGADAASSRGVASVADGEYKPVTVLCCTLADVPTLSTRLGPEALYHVM
jgi:hypothetical protein